MKGPRFKMTRKTKFLLWIYRNWPRIDQWAINHCDFYPCDDCVHFDNWGCMRNFMNEDCKYEKIDALH